MTATITTAPLTPAPAVEALPVQLLRLNTGTTMCAYRTGGEALLALQGGACGMFADYRVLRTSAPGLEQQGGGRCCGFHLETAINHAAPQPHYADEDATPAPASA